MLGCIRSGVGEEVLVGDAWNTDVSTGNAARGNGFDTEQVGVCTYSTSFLDGRISCTLVTFVCLLVCCLLGTFVGAL